MLLVVLRTALMRRQMTDSSVLRGTRAVRIVVEGGFGGAAGVMVPEAEEWGGTVMSLERKVGRRPDMSTRRPHDWLVLTSTRCSPTHEEYESRLRSLSRTVCPSSDLRPSSAHADTSA